MLVWKPVNNGLSYLVLFSFIIDIIILIRNVILYVVYLY